MSEDQLMALIESRLEGTKSKIDLGTRCQATYAMVNDILEVLIRSNVVIFDDYSEGSLGEGNPFSFTIRETIKTAETGIQIKTNLTATTRHKDEESSTVGDATPDMVDELTE